MARPLRIEFPGAVYHATARGDRREPIFEDDEDRDAGIRAAVTDGPHSMTDIGKAVGLTVSRVSRM